MSSRFTKKNPEDMSIFFYPGSNGYITGPYVNRKTKGDDADEFRLVKEKEYLSDEDMGVVTHSLNAYFHQANDALKRKDLGDIERQNYEHQKKKSKELMEKLDRFF